MVRPHRTSTNHCDALGRRPIGQFRASSGWFDFAEPPRTPLLLGLQGSLECVLGGLTTPHLLEPLCCWGKQVYRAVSRNKVCRMLSTSSGWLKRLEPFRTLSNHIIAEIMKALKCKTLAPLCYRGKLAYRVVSSEFGVVRPHQTSCLGWFDHTEPQ